MLPEPRVPHPICPLLEHLLIATRHVGHSVRQLAFWVPPSPSSVPFGVCKNSVQEARTGPGDHIRLSMHRRFPEHLIPVQQISAGHGLLCF